MHLSKDIVEIRFHARAGQGAWTASRLLAQAALLEGKHVQSFPAFGPERRGAPMVAFARLSDKPLELHCEIYNPDIVAVLDPTLLKTQDITGGLSENGILVINTKKTPQEIREELGVTDQKIFTVKATDIAVEVLGRDITNTAILGTIVRAANLVKLEHIYDTVRDILKGKKVDENIRVIKRSYEEAVSG